MTAASSAAGASPSSHTDRPSMTPAPRRLLDGKPCAVSRSRVLQPSAEPGTPRKSSEIAFS